MNDEAIHIRFDGNGRIYHPGETLSGEYWLEPVEPGEVRAMELSILWHTEGKGDEDISVHEFQRVAVEDGRRPVGLPRTLLHGSAQQSAELRRAAHQGPLVRAAAGVSARAGDRGPASLSPGQRAAGQDPQAVSQRDPLPSVDNPFSTRRVKPGAIAYVFPPGEDLSTLLERLRAARGGDNWSARTVPASRLCWPRCGRRWSCRAGGRCASRCTTASGDCPSTCAIFANAPLVDRDRRRLRTA